MKKNIVEVIKFFISIIVFITYYFQILYLPFALFAMSGFDHPIIIIFIVLYYIIFGIIPIVFWIIPLKYIKSEKFNFKKFLLLYNRLWISTKCFIYSSVITTFSIILLKIMVDHRLIIPLTIIIFILIFVAFWKDMKISTSKEDIANNAEELFFKLGWSARNAFIKKNKAREAVEKEINK